MNRYLTFVVALAGAGLAGARPVPSPARVLAQVESAQYPDANAVIVFDSTATVLRPTGSATIVNHRLVKILTSFGKKKFSEASFGYCTLYDTVVVVAARVIRPDGTILPVSASDIVDLPMKAEVSPQAAGGNFYLPNVRLKKITFAGLEPGGAIEIISRDELRRPPRASQFDTWDLFIGDEPILNKTFTLVAPAHIAVQWKVENGALNFSRAEGAGTVRYRWSADSIAPIVQEPAMPPVPDVATKLLVATEPDFTVWSKWLYQLSKPRWALDRAGRSKAVELTRDARTDAEKIQAVYRFVCREIRYLSTGLTGRYAGYEPAPADQTLERREGLARDRVALFVGLLAAVGVEAYPAFSNMQFEVNREVAADQFNHVIAAVRRPGGAYCYLDPIVEVAADDNGNYLLPVEADRPVLVATPDGEGLGRTPALPAAKNLIATTGRAAITGAGDLTGALTIQPEGFFDFTLRNSIRQVPADQRKQVIEQFVKSISASGEMTGFTVSDLSDPGRPLVIEMQYQVADYGIKVEDELNFQMPGGSGSSLGVGGAGTSTPWASEARNYPVNFWSTMSSAADDTITIPRGWKVKRLPAAYSLDRERFSCSFTCSVDRTTVVRSIRFAIKDRAIPLTDYADFRALMLKIEDLGKESITIVRQK